MRNEGQAASAKRIVPEGLLPEKLTFQQRWKGGLWGPCKCPRWVGAGLAVGGQGGGEIKGEPHR